MEIIVVKFVFGINVSNLVNIYFNLIVVNKGEACKESVID